jgi:hypothetical protein
VEQSCYKCGAAVEEGVAFCPHCNAPQIRVIGTEPVASAAARDSPSVVLSNLDPDPRVPLTTSIQWPRALPAAALSGLVAALLMLTPLGAFGLGMLAAGILCVFLYRRVDPFLNLTPWTGARLGAASGAMGFAILMTIFAIGVAAFNAGGEIHQKMLDAIQQAAARSSDPQAQQAVEFFKTAPGLTLFMILGSILLCIMFVLFSGLGGALGAVLLRRKDQL